MIINCTINGKPRSFDTDPTRRALDLLREDFGLTGVKEGCGEGECGACSIFLNGKLANSCLLSVLQLSGAEIFTVEGIRDSEEYKVLEASFSETGAVQCGFCTPGFIMASLALLRRNPKPSKEQVKTALAGNLCRCTGYSAILDGVLLASRRGSGIW